ncbi:MAG: hypothetical protein TH68_08105 [Candidatus Synechococcus spongiarum 142]|uniref:DUF3727 domain-containing protein n=1 Tax=Candidatus Synechococcus spongiarum 142 TaxID=1608213 RepID=A0A6N3XBG7_9SYNE|nr:MAG: hypothetical protein TH68_08105 [Candidatus Synechococcus spongiarum 142]
MDHPGDEGNTAVANVMAADAAGRLLHCVVEQSIRIQGQDYGLLSPVDTPAHLCRWPDDSSAEPELIADPHQYPQVLDQLDMILQDEGLVLVRSAGLLTVAGDLDNVALDIDPGMDWDGAEAAMDASDLLHQVGATDDDDLDTYVLLASACQEGTDFGLYGSLNPCFLLARLGPGAAELLMPDELAQLQPLVEEALAHDEEVCP